MRILLCDDHRIMRDGLRAILERAGFVVVGEAADGRQGLRLAEELAPDVVLMDISMPELNGIDATRALVGRCPGVKVLGLSMSAEPRYVRALLAAGASGYVLKSSAAKDLIEALHTVAAGAEYVSPDVARERAAEPGAGVAPSAPPSSRAVRPLSGREREVLQLLAEGHSSKEIALRLCVATTTIESHRRQIMDKLNIRTIAELTKYAIREGLTSVD